MLKIFFTVLGLSLAAQVTQAQDNFRYQGALRNADTLAKQKRCWALTRAEGLTLVEFSQVRAYCWARQTPNIVNNNPVYNSSTLSRVRGDVAASERTEQAESSRRVQQSTWLQEELRLELNCRGNYAYFSRVPTPTDFSIARPHGTCQCREGYVVQSSTPQLVCELEEVIEVITVIDHSRDETSEVNDFVTRYWASQGNGRER